VRVEYHLLGLARIGPNEQHAAVTVTVTPLISTISCDQSNWYASPGAKLSGT
jgi:hypothetical protein